MGRLWMAAYSSWGSEKILEQKPRSASPSRTLWQTWLDMPVEKVKSQPGCAALNWRHRRVTRGTRSRGMVWMRRVPMPSRSIWKLRRQLSARVTICWAWGRRAAP